MTENDKLKEKDKDKFSIMKYAQKKYSEFHVESRTFKLLGIGIPFASGIFLLSYMPKVRKDYLFKKIGAIECYGTLFKLSLHVGLFLFASLYNVRRYYKESWRKTRYPSDSTKLI